MGDVSDFLAVTCSSDRKVAERYLNNAGGDLGRAIQDYFSHPPSTNSGRGSCISNDPGKTVVSDFLAVTCSSDRKVAERYLANAHGDLDRAVQDYLDHPPSAPSKREYEWYSIDPVNGNRVTYSDDMQKLLEDAYQTEGSAMVPMTLGQHVMKIDVVGMKQWNSRGGKRKVGRHPPDAPRWRELRAAKANASVTPELLKACLGHIAGIDEQVVKMDQCIDAAVPIPPSNAIDTAVAIFNAILTEFSQSQYKQLYGSTSCDDNLASISFGDKVPAYFANVKSGSIYQRKMLTLLGLRNLLSKGSEIFQEFKDAKFSGQADAYPRHTGISKMKHFTGNVVDLDTTVLRCSDGSVLRMINATRRKEKKAEFKNAADFGASSDARDIALAASIPQLEAFSAQLKLTPQQRQQRCVFQPPQDYKIPIASNNTDRGRWPVWQYVNEGVNSFHVNVPNLPDVYGALLKAPWHTVRAYCCIRLKYDGTPERDEKMKAFFEDCVVDSCFNAKWKAIEEFNNTLDEEESVATKLAILQRDNARTFDPLFDIDEKDECIAAVVKATYDLVSRKQLTCIEGGATKAISLEMVEKWVEASLEHSF